MANAHPKIALSVSRDIPLQRSHAKEPYQIRRLLTEGAVRASDKRAQFVGLESYEEAGGTILRDLFEPDDGGWLQEPVLLEKLVAEKLEREAEAIRAEGWKWVEVAPELAYGHAYGLRRLSGTEVPITDEEQAAHDALQVEFDQLFAQHAFEGRATDLLATVGSHLVTREQQPGRALLLEAFAAARRNPEVARLLREHLIERSARMASLVDASKASGLVDPTLDTRSIVHFAHAVGLGFLLFEAIGADHPDPASWEEVVRRVVESVVPAGENPPER